MVSVILAKNRLDQAAPIVRKASSVAIIDAPTESRSALVGKVAMGHWTNLVLSRNNIAPSSDPDRVNSDTDAQTNITYNSFRHKRTNTNDPSAPRTDNVTQRIAEKDPVKVQAIVASLVKDKEFADEMERVDSARKHARLQLMQDNIISWRRYIEERKSRKVSFL